MNILVPLGAFLEGAVGPLAVKVLTSLGIGIISYGSLVMVINSAISLAQSKYTGLPSVAFNLAALAGFGECMSLIASAVVFRVTFLVQRKTLGVLNK